MRRSILLLSTILIAGCSDPWPFNDPVEPKAPPDLCFEAIEAIENGDQDALGLLGVPAFIAADILDGAATRRLCSSSGNRLTSTFLLTIERDSGQIVRDNKTMRHGSDAAVVDVAVDSLSDKVGVFVVSDQVVSRLMPVDDNDQATPIRSILE